MYKIEDSSFRFSLASTLAGNMRLVTTMSVEDPAYKALQELFGEDLGAQELRTTIKHSADGKGVIAYIKQVPENTGCHFHKGTKPNEMRLDVRVPPKDKKKFKTISSVSPSWIEAREDGLYFGIDYDATKPAILRPRKGKTPGHGKARGGQRFKVMTDTLDKASKTVRLVAPTVVMQPSKSVLIESIVEQRDALRKAIEEFNKQGKKIIEVNLEMKLVLREETIL